MIYKGRTALIHGYHQANIKESDKKAYGRAFAKGMFSIALTLLLSGLTMLFGESPIVLRISLAELFIGFIISFAIIGKVQKKYNGGIF